MPTFIWEFFSRIITWGLGYISYTTVWITEKSMWFAPNKMRQIVNRYATERIFACVVSGNLPLFPQLNGGDGILFYPLAQCERYEILELPELNPTPLFEGKILGVFIPPESRQKQYHLCGYDKKGNCFDAGRLFSRGKTQSTQIIPGLKVQSNRLKWKTFSFKYLASFIMIHTNMKPHAAAYSQRSRWKYPQTKHLPHIVISPDGINLDHPGLKIMVMIVDKDAWVSKILIPANEEN